jgi:hypothetical protein
VTDEAGFSPALLKRPIAKVPSALDRIRLGKRRVQSVLDQHTVAHRRTLEQKISEQGPRDQRIDPHLLGHAIDDLIALNRLAIHRHAADAKTTWYANPGTAADVVATKLNLIAPLHHQATSKHLGNLIGDALEVVVFKALVRSHQANPRYSYAGHFELDQPKNEFGRYRKIKPPKTLHGRTTAKEPDFYQYGHEAGVLCIECKNYREWFYPRYEGIKTLIIRASDLGVTPVLIARRLHYTTRTNLLEPAGIIAHETYYQYYPADHAKLAAQMRDRNSLGFTDVNAVEEPHNRTIRFFTEILPNINGHMAVRWNANKGALLQYARDEINLAQLYNAIGSPAAGNWQEPEPDEPNPFE